MSHASRVKVMIAHSAPLLNAGLDAALRMHDDFDVHTPCGLQAIEAHPVPIDVVVTDCETGTRLAALGRATGYRVLVLTHDDTETAARRAIEAGVKGYLTLASSAEAIASAAMRVAHGGTAIDPCVLAAIAEGLSGSRLSSRELDVLRLAMRGFANKAIANRIGVTEGTVKCHMKSLLGKLDAKSRTEAVFVAQRRGLLRPDGTTPTMPRSAVSPRLKDHAARREFQRLPRELLATRTAAASEPHARTGATQ